MPLADINAPKTSRDYLSFRPAIDTDFDILAEMRRDTEMQGLLMTIPDATDDESVRGWIARRSQDDSGIFRVIAETETNRALGYLQITGIHHRNRTGYGGIAISKRARVPGLGQAAMRHLMAAAANELNLAKLMAEIRIDNFTAIQLNMSAGYRIVGTLEQHFRGPTDTYDALLLERLLGAN